MPKLSYNDWGADMKISDRMAVLAVAIGSVVLTGSVAAAGVGDDEPDATTTTEASTTTSTETTSTTETTAPSSTTDPDTTATTRTTPAPSDLGPPEEDEGPGEPSEAGRGPDPTGPARHGLCRAFSGRTEAPGISRAYANLLEAANGDIDAYCAPVLAEKEARKAAGGDDDEHEDSGEQSPPKERPDKGQSNKGQSKNKGGL